MFTALVADDEPLAREELKYLLEHSGEVRVVAEAESGEEALKLLKTNNVDVVFLDIHMFGEDGLSVARKVRNERPETVIIFVTAYDQHAVQAFDLNAADYLLKPFGEERLKEALLRVHKLKDKEQEKRVYQDKNHFCFQGKDRIFCLNLNEIMYVEAAGRNAYLKIPKDKIIVRNSLSEIEMKLKDYNFLRVHKSFLVNLETIREIVPLFHSYVLKINDDVKTEIPVGRTYIKNFKERMGL